MIAPPSTTDYHVKGTYPSTSAYSDVDPEQTIAVKKRKLIEIASDLNLEANEFGLVAIDDGYNNLWQVVKSLRNGNEELKQRHTSMELRANKQNERIEGLEKEIEKLKKENERMTEKIERITDKIESQDKQIEMLIGQSTLQTQQITLQTQQITFLAQRSEAQDVRIQKLEYQNEQISKHIEANRVEQIEANKKEILEIKNLVKSVFAKQAKFATIVSETMNKLTS